MDEEDEEIHQVIAEFTTITIPSREQRDMFDQYLEHVAAYIIDHRTELDADPPAAVQALEAASYTRHDLAELVTRYTLRSAIRSVVSDHGAALPDDTASWNRLHWHQAALAAAVLEAREAGKASRREERILDHIGRVSHYL